MEMWSFIFKIALVICSVSTDYVIIARAGIKEIAASVKLVVNLTDIKISSMSGDILASILHFMYTNVAKKEQKLMTNIIWILLLNFLCSWSSEVMRNTALAVHAAAARQCSEPEATNWVAQSCQKCYGTGCFFCFCYYFFFLRIPLHIVFCFPVSVSVLLDFTVTDLTFYATGWKREDKLRPKLKSSYVLNWLIKGGISVLHLLQNWDKVLSSSCLYERGKYVGSDQLLVKPEMNFNVMWKSLIQTNPRKLFGQFYISNSYQKCPYTGR